MNLIIDIGNTQIKYFIFLNKNVINSGFSNSLNEILINIKTYFDSINAVIYSDVRGIDTSILHDKFQDKIVYSVKSNCFFPFKILYKTTESIGEDRLGLISSAFLNFPKKNVLVIDVGSCITYDLLTKEGHYLGGAISPGFSIRYKSLNQCTGKLPLVDYKKIPNKNIGDSTESSINIGVYYGVYYEIIGIIDSYFLKYQDLTVILTGGDVNILPKSIKNTIFANQNFLAQGLNHLIEFNRN